MLLPPPLRARRIAAQLAVGETVVLGESELGHATQQSIAPDPRLLMIGAGHCGLALQRAAVALDYEIHAVDVHSAPDALRLHS